MGDTECLYKRFVERDMLPERGQANMWPYKPSLEEFTKWCSNLKAFSVGGETTEIDSTDFEKVDFESHIETARAWICR